MRREVVLVDASVYVFRAWHSMPDEFTDLDGNPVNAVHGFLRFLLELLERTRPSHIAVAFDEALESSFRNDIYPAYKANRDPAPAELKQQFAHCQSLTRALGLATLVDSRYEADDLIGSTVARLRPQGFDALIVSADKDLSQLLRGQDCQWDFARDRRWRADEVHARFGARAERLADFFGLTGDSVDNIPGVPGIGEKTASALLDHFDTLDALLARVDEVPFLRLRGAKSHALKLKQYAEQALLSRRLATIAEDASVPAEAEDYRIVRAPGSDLSAHLDHLRVGPLTRRRIQGWLDGLAAAP